MPSFVISNLPNPSRTDKNDLAILGLQGRRTPTLRSTSVTPQWALGALPRGLRKPDVVLRR